MQEKEIDLSNNIIKVISRYGMNLYRGCTHIKAERKKLTLWICRLFNIADKGTFINYEERIEKNKRNRQSNREDYTRNTRNWKLILLQKIIDRIKIKSNKILKKCLVISLKKNRLELRKVVEINGRG